MASASAYWIQFNAESRCASKETLRSWSGSTSRGCQARFPRKASSAFVTNTGTSDDNTVVVFYSSQDCNPEDAIARVESGCVGIESENLEIKYQSFNVIRTFDSARITPISKNEFGYQHGGIKLYKGVEYRWLKQLDGSFRGVFPEEWDDATLKQRKVPTSVSWEIACKEIESACDELRHLRHDSSRKSFTDRNMPSAWRALIIWEALRLPVSLLLCMDMSYQGTRQGETGKPWWKCLLQRSGKWTGIFETQKRDIQEHSSESAMTEWWFKDFTSNQAAFQSEMSKKNTCPL